MGLNVLSLVDFFHFMQKIVHPGLFAWFSTKRFLKDMNFSLNSGTPGCCDLYKCEILYCDTIDMIAYGLHDKPILIYHLAFIPLSTICLFKQVTVSLK